MFNFLKVLEKRFSAQFFFFNLHIFSLVDSELLDQNSTQLAHPVKIWTEEILLKVPDFCLGIPHHSVMTPAFRTGLGITSLVP